MAASNPKTGPKTDRPSLPDQSRPVPIWIGIVAVLGAILTAAGAVIALVNPAMLVSPHDAINNAVHVYAGYLFSRNLVIAVMLVALLIFGARRALSQLLVLVGLIQLADAFVDVVEARWAVASGVLILGILFLVAATRLASTPFWRTKAWRP